MRGQFLSMDFLLALSLLTVAIGLFSQNLEVAQKNAATAKLAVNPAEVIAEQIVNVCPDPNGCTISGLLPAFCYRYYYVDASKAGHYADYSGGELTALGLWHCFGSDSCSKTWFSARRLIECPPSNPPFNSHSPCLLEVKTCG